MAALVDVPAGTSVAWADALPPTRGAALARIARVRPADYARTRNHLDGAVTGLSPYLTHGLVTLREVLAGVLEREPLPVQHKLVSELGWREYFRHVWAHEGDRILHSLHPGPRPDTAYAPALPPDIRQARTGVPVIDEAVRTLYATGTLHNHARLWLASYLVHLRHVHWRAGADWLVAHLRDGDLASNHLSWQWVAGTGSAKPYLFNADNVARYAPAHWHSPGTVVDQSYEALERMARDPHAATVSADTAGTVDATPEPPLLAAPPTDLSLHAPDAAAADRLRGREVWLVHPWALRAPAAVLSDGAVVIGLYLREYHQAWPWSAARWRWVDAAMAAVAPRRWYVDAAGLAGALADAARVRSIDDPHFGRRLQPVAQQDAAPTLFPPVERRCGSFSQWWTRATRGLHGAKELL
ncbi:FAD-binding domain-containing protein [Candidatus Thiodictyon syntrophicum]|jgi:deoxyribodipyrimidine photo-lyase|uniref:Deoxyribodipyrimidine photolyase n=1 Tax=Candidatus Thiodictyon syntrophicum TaxID=1166950 RepID=A0A2K8U6S6_9GAMM|nr:FAD-binding domain-containing protein [Candidatus Thiodictyon syntrophicum]AUB81255.1 deoxyribodipyrimidine photolyase [Candidatus Thiodictyon syntrophicum]